MLADHRSGCSRSVLIVDESEEAREVLCTLLRRRGVSTLEAAGALSGLEILKQCHADVVVLDLEAECADDERVRDAFDLEVQRQHSHLIVLGRARRYCGSLPEDQRVAKPYHYAPLIRTIERLCEEAAPCDS